MYERIHQRIYEFHKISIMDTWFEKLMVIEAIIEADNEMQRIKDKIGMLHEI